MAPMGAWPMSGAYPPLPHPAQAAQMARRREKSSVRFVLVGFLFLCCAVQVFTIIASRSHYTVDVVVACYTSVLLWTVLWDRWPDPCASANLPDGSTSMSSSATSMSASANSVATTVTHRMSSLRPLMAEEDGVPMLACTGDLDDSQAIAEEGYADAGAGKC